MKTADFLQRSELNPARRTAILHADDVGMCHGANTAFVDLSETGALTCGSVMEPCPWFPEIAGIAAEDATLDAPKLDLGVHMTLTCEWPNYRWAPLTRASKSSGLIDDHGYFPRTVAALTQYVEPDAAEAEMRAQLDRAIASGIDVTHIDTHMGAALSAPLAEAYCRIGRDYRLPVLLPRQSDYYMRVLKFDAEAAREIWAQELIRLEAAGEPLVDDFRMTPGAANEDSEDAYRDLVQTLPEGITFVALHPNASGDIETIVPPRAHFRTDEHRLLGEGRIAQWLEEANVQTLGMRPFRDALRGESKTR